MGLEKAETEWQVRGSLNFVEMAAIGKGASLMPPFLDRFIYPLWLFLLLGRCHFLDQVELARVVMAVAFLLDKHLAANLREDSPNLSILSPDFLSCLELLVIHALHLISWQPSSPSDGSCTSR